MALTPPPTAPSTSDPSTFDSRADAHVAWLATNVTELGALQTDVAAKQATASAAATTATTQAGLATTNGAAQVALATTQAGNAATSATAAATSAEDAATNAGAAMWNVGTSYAIGAAATSASTFRVYRRTIAGSGGSEPALDPTNWTLAAKSGLAQVATATANTTLTNTPTLLDVTPAAAGVRIKMPDATTVQVGGPLHVIRNNGPTTIAVCNNTGAPVAFVPSGGAAVMYCTSTASVAGAWVVGNQSYTPTTFTNLSVGTAAVINALAISTQTSTTMLSPTKALVAYTDSVGGKAVVLDLSGTTITAGTPVALGNTSRMAVTTLTGTSVLCGYFDAGATLVKAVVFSISGNAITVNTALTITGTAMTVGYSTSICTLSATKAMFCLANSSQNLATVVLDVSGTTVTQGTVVILPTIVVASVSPSTSVVTLSSTKAMVTYVNNANTIVYALILDVSGSTVTQGTALTVYTGTNVYNGAVVFVNSTRAVMFYSYTSTNAAAIALSVSGSTITAGTPLLTLTGSFTGTAAPIAVSVTPTSLLQFSKNTGISGMAYVPVAVSGTTLTAGAAVNINTVAGSTLFSAAASGNTIVTAYLGASSYLETIALEAVL